MKKRGIILRNQHRTVRGIALLAVTTILVAGCGNLGRTATTPTERLQIELTSPTPRDPVTDAETTITGVISEATATVTVNDDSVDVASDGSFTYTLPLEYGSNRIAVRATKEDFRDASRTITITRSLTLTIDSPDDGAVVAADRITISGSLSDTSATLQILGYEVPVNEAGGFSREIRLLYPTTIIPISATIEDREPVSQTLTVTYTNAVL